MKIFRLLAALLDYPSDELLRDLRESVGANASSFVEGLNEEQILSADEVRSVADFITTQLAADPMELQGSYVQCFDLTAEHSLHLTHHLFGEEKSRGPALIDLGEFYRSYGLQADEKELPDYLPVILEFVSTLGLDEAWVFLADVAKVLKVLAENLEKSASPYASLVRIVEKQGSLTNLAA
ncbi:MAG TPA: nitrate reductase molybdenum cofactor assembly chaperone [Aromatoleum sp.]|uniref:nitrate reductase molybdenum cofactor assembly chaperone n=1 Tax=Aromatoleum sp. TaxID=2307007 RepID=UPI002B4AA7C2|nr:nitrate reductase molybdenum cofactor assembly chaperone [Aromatoleum sp.]HJV27567.1 nitrate reductase molybdenum cofactor assembly chaperone [Aromatoleum sp.]